MFRGKPKDSAAPDAQRSADKRAAYERHKSAAAARQRDLAKAGQDLGTLPDPVDRERREACRYDLQRFVETYLRSMFKGIKRRWSGFHTFVFKLLQDSILSPSGDQVAVALPRGSGKTTMTMAAIIWAAVYGHCKFAVVICASDPLAIEFLDDIKTQFEVQPLLLEDFPEVCIPIRALERKTQRCNSQTCNGEPTRIEWNQDVIVLPTVAGSEASGFRFKAAGLTGSGIRGLKFAAADGSINRPDIVVLDDPQTDESARSLEQCKTRLRLVNAVMAMAGPGEKITVLACVTVIREGDVADTLLKNPDWQGVLYGVIERMPGKEAMILWRQYRDIQIDSKNRRLGKSREIEFYRANQAVMDDTVATWPDRFIDEAEISGIQHAMNWFFKLGIAGFMAEFMNTPEKATEAEIFRLDPEQVRNRLTGLKRRVVPNGYDFVTIGVDIQLRLIFFVVIAWKMDMTGSIIDYGYMPKQKRKEFTLDDLDKTLQSESGAIDANVDAAVSWGLVNLGKHLFEKPYIREDGLEIFVPKGQIDINYRLSQNAVGRFCRTSNWKSIFTPAMGMGMTKTRKRISEWKSKPGQNWPDPRQRRDCEWMETNPKEHGCREVYFDPNHWKSFVNTAFSMPLHSPGSLSIFGDDPEEHRQLSAHVTSHYAVDVEINGVKQTQWALRPTVERDDLLDCCVGSAVSASRNGARLTHITSALPAVDEPGERRTVQLPSDRRNLRSSL